MRSGTGEDVSINCLTVDQTIPEAIPTPLNFLVTKGVYITCFTLLNTVTFEQHEFELRGSTYM